MVRVTHRLPTGCAILRIASPVDNLWITLLPNNTCLRVPGKDAVRPVAGSYPVEAKSAVITKAKVTSGQRRPAVVKVENSLN